MDLMQFQEMVNGYTARLFDQQLLAVDIGFWAGYYVNAKRPKKVKDIMQSMIDAKYKDKRAGTVPDVDVEAFLEQERLFKKRQQELER